jgi:aminomethyltransferase
VTPSELRHSPLDAEHRALGARMVEFGGWEMPIQYTSVLEEHRACRQHAVVFDVSHLGSVRVTGSGARALLQRAFTNDLGRIAPGQAQYTHLLEPDDGHVVDDIIVWWVEPDVFLVMPNASNTSRIAAALASEDGCNLEDITATRAIVAVQGPEARERLASVVPEAAQVPRFAVRPVLCAGAPGFAAGTGYTGEDGVELHVPVEVAGEVWRAVVAAGARPAGLGARDTLRLEAGLPLHGHELGPGITPLQAGLPWVVRFDKGPFRGREALLAERERGVARRLRGLLVDGRQVPRGGCRVSIDGEPVGEVTSGNFSPMLEQGIGLAFLAPGVADGTEVEIDVRGRPVPARVVKPPFWARAHPEPASGPGRGGG